MQRVVSKVKPNLLKIGDLIHGYRLEQIDYIKELNIRPFYLKHEATGAEHLHIHKEGDSNNVFAVSLRTTPKNSTGVAHILEHMALCSSQRYPVRDPFFKMLTRSLATFMNAMTGPDFTVYPFATQNKKDFENLLNVYTDAVFFPRLRPVDFRQEGWRLEHETPDKQNTPIIIRGVVYNEMKGVFSASSSIYTRSLLNNLFPDTTYRYESGGDPHNIPDLTHDELKKFHRLHYHPSNAKFYTYGDMPMENHLKLLNEIVMSKFSENSQAKEQSIVSEQIPWDKPRTSDITCAEDPLCPDKNKQATTSVSYMLPTTNTNHDDMLASQILSSLLLDGPNAPFHKSLIESGIGADYSPGTGLGNYTKQPYFSVGLQNINPNDIAKVHEIIDKTLREASENGFPSERVDAILHNIELGLKHISGNLGLRLLMNFESTWNHDGDIFDYFRINKHVEKFKNDLASDKNYWKNLISRHFLTNNHKLILNMRPDPAFEDKRKELEKNLLESKLSNLDEVERQTILYEGMELKKIQNSKDDPDILPCLEASKDIEKDDPNQQPKLKFDSYKGVNLQSCEQLTNEVVYFRALMDISDRLDEVGLLDYLPVFCSVATKLGAGKYSRHEFAQRAQLTTGGLGVSEIINPSLSEIDVFKNEVLIESHCLRRNVENMFELWSNVFKEIHFQQNKDFLFQMIKAAAADLADGISHRGQFYAIRRSTSALTKIGSMEERLSGLSYVARLKDMASKESIESIAMKLQHIAKIALDPYNMKCAINAEPDAIDPTMKELQKMIDRVQEYSASAPSYDDGATSQQCEAAKVENMKFSFATHYVAKSLLTVPKLHEDFPKLVIMSKLVSSRYLLQEIREKGGAYGAGARISNSGTLSFFSYRDPNSDRTLRTFDSSAKWLTDGSTFNERDVEESKLGVFQDIDRPVEPGRRGLNYFISGETSDMRQDFRRRLLDVTKEDIIEVASKYLENPEKSGSYII